MAIEKPYNWPGNLATYFGFISLGYDAQGYDESHHALID